MRDLNSINLEITEMSKAALKMLQITHQAFMEHDPDLISQALKEESKLNEQERTITTGLIELVRGCVSKQERSKATLYADIAGDLEIIGDYCKDILERIQMKIEEKLLFSDEAVKEYNQLYGLTENALKEIVSALDRDKPDLAKRVLKNKENVDNLVAEFRRRHNQRLIDGICIPFACNMFLNMLDFTGQIFHHAKSIAKNILKLK